jgi:hypothetical protein
MNKIASTTELQAELQRLLAYAAGRPSRARIARELEQLGRRLTAGFGDATGEPADSAKRPGEYNIFIRHSRPTRWDLFVENPKGGGGGSSSYPSAKRALAAAVTRDTGLLELDKVWVIIAEWSASQEDYVVSKAFWQKLPMV